MTARKLAKKTAGATRASSGATPAGASKRSPSPGAERLRRVGFTSKTVRFLEKHGPRKIAGDYVLPSATRLVGNNTRIPNIPPDWLCFAEAGSGDLWLLDRESQTRVAFWNHDLESRAKAEPLGIDLRQWLELAEYMRSFDKRWRANEHALARRDLSREAKAFLQSLSPTLAKKYPYRLR